MTLTEVIIMAPFILGALFCGLAVIMASNPMHSVFYLVLSFASTVMLLLFLGVEFLSLLFLIVYVGAIAILFLFVVMMLNIKDVEMADNATRYVPAGFAAGVVFLYQVVMLLQDHIMTVNSHFSWTHHNFDIVFHLSNINILGLILYTDYVAYFILASLVLLVSMLGAIVLTLGHQNVKRQELAAQINTRPENSIYAARSPSLLPVGGGLAANGDTDNIAEAAADATQFISWAWPDLFLMTGTLIILIYGVIYSKLGSQWSQLAKVLWLGALVLVLTSILKSLVLINWIECNLNTLYFLNGQLELSFLILIVQNIVIFSSIVILLISLDYFLANHQNIFEYVILILLSVCGMLILVCSSDLISLYLAIELLSLSLYVLSTLERNRQYSTEAGLKYFLLGALASGFLLLGCCLLYAFSGETSFEGLNIFLWYSGGHNLGLRAGLTLVLVALFFKLAAAPFHMWAPDVYEGSPTIVTAYFAIVPKIAILTLVIKLAFGVWLPLWFDIQILLFLTASLSLIVGALGGLNQNKFKRLIAYSAIGHMGFILLALTTFSSFGLQASLFYILLYIIMSFSSFCLILVLPFWQGSLNFISQLSGLSRTSPFLALTFVITLFSMAGIPPLAGFFSKYLVLMSCIDSHFFLLSFLAVSASVISCFYYLRVIKWIYFSHSISYFLKNSGHLLLHRISVPVTHSFILGFSAWCLISLLFYPDLLFEGLGYSASGLGSAPSH